MNGPYCLSDVVRIVQTLASLPGSVDVNIQTRRLPRLGPAEEESAYQERSVSLNVLELRDVPVERLGVCVDADEIIITVRGMAASGEVQEEIVSAAWQVRASSWDYRVRFNAPSAYELSAFTNFPCRNVAFPEA